jgi:hypothetical protein
MKKIIICCITTLFLTNILSAQDILTKKNGEDIKAKVLEVTNNEVKYKKFDNLNGPLFTILKSELLLIRYENGSKDIFNEAKKIESNSTQNEDLYIQGQSDANKYYKGYKSSGTAVISTSLLLSPLVGLVPAVLCSTTEPQDENLNYPSSELMKKTEYSNGYRQKAKKIKQNKVWKNWGIGFGINLALLLALSSSSD